jgi:4-amino-4-deoxy-L-arabinose transferase-like glycosyltransferase
VSAVAFCCFVLIFSFLTTTSSLEKSPTFDETVHLFAGYSYLKWGDFRTNPEHPPLAKILAALPLLALDIKDPRPSSPNWDLISKEKDYAVANQMIFGSDADTLFFYAKLPMVALGTIVGIFVYLWTKQLYGAGAAVAALFIYCLDPNILAHSPIVHTDIPLTAFFFIGTYFFCRALGRLTWSNLFVLSLFFGLAAITKYTFVTILPIWSILGLVKVFSHEPLGCGVGCKSVSSRWGKTVLLMGILTCALIAAYFFIWAAYSFRFNAIPGGEGHLLPLAQVMPENHFLQTLVSFSNNHHLFPEAWTYGFVSALKILRRWTYLLGQISEKGFWLYFPVAFAVKTPLPTLLLLVGTIGLVIFKRRTPEPGLLLMIPVIFYFSFAVWSRLNIGLRHLLPIYPFLFVLIGGTIAELWRDRSGFKKAGLIILGLWYLWSSFSVYPHYLAFFNELVGGAKNGYKVLLDSNLDWGQDLKGLKRWMDKNGVQRIKLAYFGTADPIYYGINALYLPGSLIFSPRPESKDPEEPKYLAVSVTYVQGAFPDAALGDYYRSLRSKQPVATIGHSIFVYRLD